jgi:hypothetical protein
MAQKVLVITTCDMEHDEETDGGETTTFSLDGNEYEFELCPADKQGMADLLDRYVKAARPLRRPRAARAQQRARQAADRGNNTEIRAWAAQQNPPIELHNRGRIPQAIIGKYEAEHGMAVTG